MQTNLSMLRPLTVITTEIHALGLALEDRAYGASTEQVLAAERATVARRHLAESRRHDTAHDAHLLRALLLIKHGLVACEHAACRSLLRQIVDEIIAAQREDAAEDAQIGEGDGHVERCQGHIRAAGAETRAIGGLLETALFNRSRTP